MALRTAGGGRGSDPRAAAAHPAPPAYADPVAGQPRWPARCPGAAAADGTEPTLVLPDDAVPTGREAAYPAPPGAAPDTEGFDEFARPAPDPVVAPEASGVPAEDLDGTRDGQDILVEEAGEPDYTALDADEFEQAVAALCERDGCEDVRVVGGAGDLGADVVAVAPDGRRVVIQCKRYDPAHKVGSGDVQRFGGTCFAVHDAEVAAVVTTSEFTEPAAEYAARCGIGCVDGPALTAWALGTGPAPWDPVR
ncbi:restriction endonuclease [Streptomyces pactum]|uniref:Restriction endonuclease n=1 Tax=Streptomyces pactum TaxID=68249 RepID=A0ABS0NS96_9ACTN|nr:restriction endonuclease [Streptomyces pactum]